MHIFELRHATEEGLIAPRSMQACFSKARPAWRTPFANPVYYRSEDHGKFTKFSRVSKQIFPYILRYDVRTAGSL
jgi:hypothetical protein